MKQHRFLLFTCIIFVLTVFLGVPENSQTQAIVSRIIVEEIDTVDTRFVQDTDYPDITFYVVPVNETGVPIQGLTEADFDLREDGSPVENFTVEEIEDPNIIISLMLLLDISGSMRGDLADLRESTIALFDYLELTDRTAVIAFNEMADGTAVDLSDPFPQINPDREMDFTSDGGALINLITGIEIEQNAGTPLYDALFKGIRLTTIRTDFGRRAVILMTDGVDEDRFGRQPGSRVADAATVIQEAQRHNIPVFTIGLGNQIDDAFLQRLATLTGGTYQQTPDAAELGELFTGIASNLKRHYRITYRSQIVPDGDLHNLTVQVGNVEESVSFRARFPVVPWVRDVQASLPRQEARSLRTLDGVKGTVTLQPAINARAAIAQVNYYLDDTLLHTATEAPWTFAWNTRTLPHDQQYLLRIEAIDDSQPANVGVLEANILVEECTIICVLEQVSPVDPVYLLAVLGLLLLLLIIFLATRKRPEREVKPAYVPSSATLPGQTPVLNFPPATPAPTPAPPAPGPTQQMDRTGFAGAGTSPRPSPKTEVLRREPETVAFLIDMNGGREFRLDIETAIGRQANNNIILDDPAISSQHAKIKLEGKQFVLYDLAATNPTKVNGMEITRHVLQEGDKIQIGHKKLVFKQVK